MEVIGKPFNLDIGWGNHICRCKYIFDAASDAITAKIKECERMVHRNCSWYIDEVFGERSSTFSELRELGVCPSFDRV